MATKLSRTDRLRILAALILAAGAGGCDYLPLWPDIPQGCRRFAMTTWGSTASPWNEVAWGTDVVWIDEPMLPQWGWKGDASSREDVCGPIGIGMVKDRIAALRLAHPNAKVWLNWSWDEMSSMATVNCGEPLGLGADVVSFDSYGGVWDFGIKTRFMLDTVFEGLEPGQQMGLVPEGHFFPEGGIDWSPIEYVLLGHLYFDWAMRHQATGRLYAFAPFAWSFDYGDAYGIDKQPQLVELYSALAREHPRCAE